MYFKPDTFHVALVGRTNTGKSTLFNRLIGKTHAIEGADTHLTRDVRVRAVGDVEYADFPGLDPAWFSDPARLAGAGVQIAAALDEAHLILWILDAKAGLGEEDMAVFRLIKKRRLPWLGIVNKVDHPSVRDCWYAENRCPSGEYLFVSASHKIGISELKEHIERAMTSKMAGASKKAATELPDAKVFQIACVGRANAGKSSFCNQMLGADRVRVSATPHTTRDVIEVPWPILGPEGPPVSMLDTAGLLMSHGALGRAKTLAVSVLQARRAIERADMAFFFVDASLGLGDTDKKIYRLLQHHYTTIIVIVNKWDIPNRVWPTQAAARKAILTWAEMPHHVIFHSTRAPARLQLFRRLIESIRHERARVFTTREMNKWVRALKENPDAAPTFRSYALKYAVQKGSQPLRIYCFGKKRPGATPQNVDQFRKFIYKSFVEYFGIRYGPVFFSFRKQG